MQEIPKEVNLLWPLLVKWEGNLQEKLYWADFSTVSVFNQDLLPLSLEESLAIISKITQTNTSQPTPLPEFIAIANSRIESISEKGKNGKFEIESIGQRTESRRQKTDSSEYESGQGDFDNKIEKL